MDGKQLILPDNPTLRDFQGYVAEMKKIRGFNVTDKFYECCLLAEETGELVAAVRKNAKGGSVGSGSKIGCVKVSGKGRNKQTAGMETSLGRKVLPADCFY